MYAVNYYTTFANYKVQIFVLVSFSTLGTDCNNVDYISLHKSFVPRSSFNSGKKYQN